MDISDKLNYNMVCLFIVNVQELLSISGVICIDGNLPLKIFKNLLCDCHSLGKIIICEPTSVPRSIVMIKGILSCAHKPTIYLTPDRSELMAMANEINIDNVEIPYVHNLPVDVLRAAAKLLSIADKAIIKLGPDGVLLGQTIEKHKIWSHLEPHKVYDQVVSVTGAGDSLIGSLLTALSVTQKSPTPQEFEDIINACMKASELSILSTRAVSDQLNSSIFSDIPWIKN